ncbi:probable tyrosyl-DNA phosphodiesterase [Spodoptera litura]|uniref:Probable tyrosyl-DNA phosphodiesterase n=1 Tax=Spodoptera litura TaxID=69820 RepID=A0A9J7DWV4_SPOLT|nr:probable tyrosyl-DNA phosphodiesterase [Spodoptera litura]
MSTPNKRKDNMEDSGINAKRCKSECPYAEKCFRLNPIHFREYSHAHLESILDSYTGTGEFPIPSKLSGQRQMYVDQLKMMVHKQIYAHGRNFDIDASSSAGATQNSTVVKKEEKRDTPSTSSSNIEPTASSSRSGESSYNSSRSRERGSKTASSSMERVKDSDYRPIVPPTRRAEDFLSVVVPKGNMASKHIANGPFHVFYTTIKDSKKTHNQPYSITFLEILDSSLGELKCSLQINFMVEIGWLLAQYYFAGYSEKKLTILYGEECSELKNISQKKPQVTAHQVTMSSPFGKHHTKMMILCYEDGSLRVVISTANLYLDDWENRTQGLWFSPSCPELPADSMPHEGDSPTFFKSSLLKYLNNYHLPDLAFYVERVKRCNFSHINVFLVASVPGSHFDADWGMTRVGSLLRQHCCIPPEETKNWPLIAQASSIGSYGKDPKLWLTGDFLHNFTKIKNQSQLLSSPPELKIVYPSLGNSSQF